MNILVVEDHCDTARVLACLLGKQGHRAVIAHGAQAALALARHSRFDLLLSDIELPDGDGWSLLGEMRELYPIAAIACTGKCMDCDIARSINAGFAAHLTKPIKLDNLLLQIDGQVETTVDALAGNEAAAGAVAESACVEDVRNTL